MSKKDFVEAEFLGISWLEECPIDEYRPDPSKPFSVQLTIRIGARGERGENLFYVDVSNSLFIASEVHRRGPGVLRGIVVDHFSASEVEPT